MKILLASKFVDWYLNYECDTKLTKEEININAIFDTYLTIPNWITENNNDEPDWIDVSDIKFINDLE